MLESQTNKTAETENWVNELKKMEDEHERDKL